MRQPLCYAGTSFSYEFVDGATGSDFTRVYLVPGLRYALGDPASARGRDRR